MTDAVETMAFAHAVPWHGKGTQVDSRISTTDMLDASGLNWQVEKAKIYMGDSPEAIPGRFALRRATDKRVYSVVSENWKPVQNSEILEFFRAWTEAGQATLETAGSLRNGAQTWALANLGTGFVLPTGDAVKGYVLMVGSHESGRATLIRTTAIRVVCANTLALALSSKAKSEVRWTHVRDFEADVARDQLAISREAIAEFGVQAQTLSDIKLTRDDQIRVLAPVFQEKVEVEDLVSGKVDMTPTLVQVLWATDNAPGAVPGTAWGLLNGVTYASDHLTKGEGALHNTWLGYQAQRKQAVLASLLTLAA